MDRHRLLLGLASVFAGLTVLLTVVSLAYSPFFVLLALPFGATTYFLWFHATGRLRERMRERAARGADSERHTGFGAGARREAARDAGRTDRRAWTNADSRTQTSADGRTRTNANRRRRRGARAGRGAVRERPGPTRSEAYRTLGLDDEADEAAVRRAYRSKVKEVHPDTESGDEESFKRVNRAYERLTD